MLVMFDLYILSLNYSVMLKSQSTVRCPNELMEIQKFFMTQFELNQQKMTIIQMPFFNFVCYTIDLLGQFSKSTLQISLNLFIIDYHLRKYDNPSELYRRFMGFIQSWKKYADKDEAKLFLTFLKKDRNQRKSVKLFLKVRKILLKTINQKILQEINLSHEDAITIVHTMSIITPEQRKTLTKKINEHFITKNIKYINNAKFNAAIICEYFMAEINNKPTQSIFDSNVSHKISKNVKKCPIEIEEFDEQSISMKQASLSHDMIDNISSRTDQQVYNKQSIRNKENPQFQQEFHELKSMKSLVSLEKCLRELSILKQKDMEIDNRFKKLGSHK